MCIAGEQTHSGEVWRWLHVGGEDQCTTSERKQLIAALVDAGAFLESLSESRAPLLSSEGESD